MKNERICDTLILDARMSIRLIMSAMSTTELAEAYGRGIQCLDIGWELGLITIGTYESIRDDLVSAYIDRRASLIYLTN